MIILNEKKEAERIIACGDLGVKPSQTLALLARYFFWEEHLDGKDLFDRLDEFMRENYYKYKPDAWHETILGKVKKAGKYPLAEIDEVEITQGEIEIINSLKSLRLERLAFTLLCIAKYGNKRNQDNNGWVCRPHNEIFKLASVPVTTKEQAIMLNTLYNLGLIGYSKKITNINIQVLFISEKSHIAFSVSDFRELGNEYMNYMKKHKYIRCCECGRLIKSSPNGRTKYCRECAGTAKNH